MKKVLFLLLLIYISSSSTCVGQPTNFNTQRNWAMNKREVSFGAGINQFLGDLGGMRKTVYIHQFPSTGWNSELRYRYRFHPYYATSSTLHFGLLRGNDAHHSAVYQHSRNLNFRSVYLQFSQNFEIILLAKEKTSRPRFAGVERIKFYQFYVFGGIGLMYYNPQTNYNNSWINLHSLRTEGQGLPGGSKPYSQFTGSAPIGIGFRLKVIKMWKIGFEFAYIPTFSDYIDDAGGVYYDPDKLAAAYGEISAQLSNPATQNTSWFAPGQARGKGKRDAYMSFSIILSKNRTYKKPKAAKQQTNTESTESVPFQ